MSEQEPEFVWVRLKRAAAIKIPLEEVDAYLALGYKVIPMRDQPEE